METKQAVVTSEAVKEASQKKPFHLKVKGMKNTLYLDKEFQITRDGDHAMSTTPVDEAFLQQFSADFPDAEFEKIEVKK